MESCHKRGNNAGKSPEKRPLGMNGDEGKRSVVAGASHLPGLRPCSGARRRHVPDLWAQALAPRWYWGRGDALGTFRALGGGTEMSGSNQGDGAYPRFHHFPPTLYAGFPLSKRAPIPHTCMILLVMFGTRTKLWEFLPDCGNFALFLRHVVRPLGAGQGRRFPEGPVPAKRQGEPDFQQVKATSVHPRRTCHVKPLYFKRICPKMLFMAIQSIDRHCAIAPSW